MNVQPNKGPTINTAVQCAAPSPNGRGYCGTLLLDTGVCPRCGAVKRKRSGATDTSTGPRRSLGSNQCDTPGGGTLLLADGSRPRWRPAPERSTAGRERLPPEMRDEA